MLVFSSVFVGFTQSEHVEVTRSTERYVLIQATSPGALRVMSAISAFVLATSLEAEGNLPFLLLSSYLVTSAGALKVMSIFSSVVYVLTTSLVALKVKFTISNFVLVLG